MIILGLTGSIGMGKSTAAAMMRRLGVPVHDSDAAVHRMLGPRGSAVAQIRQRFPDSDDPARNAIDRRALGRLVFGNPAERLALEAILHPLVRQSQDRFLKSHRHRGSPVVLLDIPLLYETGADRRVDHVIVVTAPGFVQRQRVQRRGLSPADFAARLALQMPDAEKRRRADFIVQTGLGRLYTLRQLRAILGQVKGRYR